MSEAKPFNHGLLYVDVKESLAVMRVLADIVEDIKAQTNGGEIKVIDPLPLVGRVAATLDQLGAYMAQMVEELDKK